ncbi:MAG: aspartate kinase [Myxococcota bacterium]
MKAPIVVLKFGGSSVATTEKLVRVAELVVKKQRAGKSVVVVVSAQGDTTDELLAKAKAISPEPDRRELDMLLSAGERISMALLALAIRQLGLEAVSLTGSQSGIITTASHSQARIIEVRPFRVEDELEAGRIVIVAGYQGVSYRRDVTTLGRGGSDTTAVALAAALNAESCEIYSDVDGVYTADPRVVDDAKKIDALGYAEMQELATSGAKVLNPTAVEFAKQQGIAIYARKTGSDDAGTVIRKDAPAAKSAVRGIAHETELAVIEAKEVRLPVVHELLAELARLEVHPRQISFGAHGFSAVLPLDDLHNAPSTYGAVTALLGKDALALGRGAVSLIGEGITKEPGPLLTTLSLLAEAKTPLFGVSTSSFRISLIIPADQVSVTVKHLHQRLGL